jgi:hypothetical protein
VAPSRFPVQLMLTKPSPAPLNLMNISLLSKS